MVRTLALDQTVVTEKNKLMGLGYRAPFSENLRGGSSEVSWLEVITENFLWDRGTRRENLDSLRENFAISLHGVSLSVASPEKPDPDYLRELARFIREIDPVRVSDHLCWSSLKSHHWNDLLPFPYTKENLEHICRNVSIVQDTIHRPLMLENLSAYIQSRESEMTEYEFLNLVSEKTGCEILLDLNNMIVNERNFGIDPRAELKKIDLRRVSQIHLAGHTDKGDFVVDTHSKAPDKATWDLWAEVCRKRNDIPFMIEWDSDIPDFETVITEVRRARSIQEES